MKFIMGSMILFTLQHYLSSFKYSNPKQKIKESLKILLYVKYIALFKIT